MTSSIFVSARSDHRVTLVLSGVSGLVYRCVPVCTGLRWFVPVCTGFRWFVPVFTSVYRCVRACVCMWLLAQLRRLRDETIRRKSL